jgi:excisionase family DNA binding protein
MPELLTIREAAQRLTFRPCTIRKMITRGQLAPVRIGRNIRILAAEVERVATHGTPRRVASTAPEQDKKAG